MCDAHYAEIDLPWLLGFITRGPTHPDLLSRVGLMVYQRQLAFRHE
jgi:hypothetical protein